MAKATRRDHLHDWVHNAEARVDGAKPLRVDAETERVRARTEFDYSIHLYPCRPDIFLEFFVAACQEADLSLELLDLHPCSAGDDIDYIVVFANGTSVHSPPALPLSSDEIGAELLDQPARTKATLGTIERSRRWQITPLLRGADRRRARRRPAA